MPNFRDSSAFGISPLRAISTTRYRSAALIFFHFIIRVSSAAFALCINQIRRAQPDHFVNCVTDLDLDVLPVARHTHVSVAQFTQKVKRGTRHLAQRQAKRIVLAALTYSLFHVVGKPVKPIRRTRPLDPLVRALMVVIRNPEADPLIGVGKRCKLRLGQELLPHRFPVTLDFT
jgi:hypothetical protein